MHELISPDSAIDPLVTSQLGVCCNNIVNIVIGHDCEPLSMLFSDTKISFSTQETILYIYISMCYLFQALCI